MPGLQLCIEPCERVWLFHHAKRRRDIPTRCAKCGGDVACVQFAATKEALRKELGNWALRVSHGNPRMRAWVRMRFDKAWAFYEKDRPPAIARAIASGRQADAAKADDSGPIDGEPINPTLLHELVEQTKALADEERRRRTETIKPEETPRRAWKILKKAQADRLSPERVADE